jgi:hypothetical protein
MAVLFRKYFITLLLIRDVTNDVGVISDDACCFFFGGELFELLFSGDRFLFGGDRLVDVTAAVRVLFLADPGG